MYSRECRGFFTGKGKGPRIPNRISRSRESQLLGIQFSSIYSAPARDKMVFVRVFGAQWEKEVMTETEVAVR